MTCVRDIMVEEQLEREFESIRQFFKGLGEKEKPLRIEWGTREAMWEPTYLITDFRPGHKFHDDQISDKEVMVKDFPYMHIFGDFRVFNGLTIKEFDDFLARLVPFFYELKQSHSNIRYMALGTSDIERSD